MSIPTQGAVGAETKFKVGDRVQIVGEDDDNDPGQITYEEGGLFEVTWTQKDGSTYGEGLLNWEAHELRLLPAQSAALASPRADSDERTAGDDGKWTVPRTVLVETVAQHFHDEEHRHEGYNWTWPEYADDDGRRGNSGYVSITPPVVQMECREAAERLVCLFERYTPTQPEGAVPDSLREAIAFAAAAEGAKNGPAARHYAALRCLQWVETLLSPQADKQAEPPILRAVVEVYPDRTDTRLTFDGRIRPEPSVKAVEQAIAALAAEYDARGGCPVVGRLPAGQSAGSEAETPRGVIGPIPRPTKDQRNYLDGLPTEANKFDPNMLVGSPGRYSAGAAQQSITVPSPFLVDTPPPDSTRTGQGEDWRDDPSADVRWNAGLVYGQDQLCRVLGVDPDKVSWDAATETLDGDVQSVICNILRAWAGDGWQALAARPAAPEAQGAWSFDMEAAPRDGTPVIVAAKSHQKDGEPIVGEAYIDADNGGRWWWAGESYGDYHASPLHEVGNPPYAWHPILDAPPASSGQGGR